jgi:hypothetical protein
VSVIVPGAFKQTFVPVITKLGLGNIVAAVVADALQPLISVTVTV